MIKIAMLSEKQLVVQEKVCNITVRPHDLLLQSVPLLCKHTPLLLRVVQILLSIHGLIMSRVTCPGL